MYDKIHYIFHGKIVLKCHSFWGSKAGPEHWPIFAHFALQLHSAMLANFFSELPNPRSTSGEIIQNSLNYWNRKQGLLIWSVVERINFCSNETQEICIFIFKTVWKLYFKNNEKIPGNLLKNTWKNHGNIMEFCQSGKVGTLFSEFGLPYLL